MKCPNCKNPVNEKDPVCEWCGAKLQNESTSVNTAPANDDVTSLDAELIALLEKGKYTKALKLYMTSTGENKETAESYINKLQKDIDRKEFFRKNRFATEEGYQKKLEAEHKNKKSKPFIIISILLILIGLYFICGGITLIMEGLGYDAIEIVGGILLTCASLAVTLLGIKLLRKGIKLKRIGSI